MKTLPQCKNMKNITITQKQYEKLEKYEKHKIYGSGWEAGETPATLAALAAPAAPTENRMILRLTALYVSNIRTLQSLLLSLKEVVRYEMLTMTSKHKQILLKCCSAKTIRLY